MLNPYIEAWQLRDLLVKKEVKVREVAEFFNQRIQRLNPKLGAFMTHTADRASPTPPASKRPVPRTLLKCRSLASPIA